MFAPVEPVPAEPPRHSLVRTAITPRDDVRWENGFAWRAERCITSTVYDACTVGTLPGSIGPDEGLLNYYRPFVIRVEDECSTRTGDSTIDEARVRRQLEATTSFRLARELWAGAHTQANPYATPETGGTASATNRWLARTVGVETYGDTFTPLDGLGQLEELARRNFAASNTGASMGQDVWIHAPIEVAPLLERALEPDGPGKWRTKTGAVMVFDAGYLGTNPSGEVQGGRRWMYATGPVAVRLSPVETRRFIDQRTNRILVSAERVAAAYFDSCVHHGLAVVMPTTS